VSAHTIFSLQEKFVTGHAQFALLEAELKTGRTHQIRVHLSQSGFPIAGDDKYGDFTLNKNLARTGASQLKRMFLHAWRLGLTHPADGVALQIEAPLPPECQSFLTGLRREQA
jgi:23S rRNA pseudouridine955/2504/2580 synthase